MNKRDEDNIDYGRMIWEGWTVGDFIRELQPVIDLIMRGESCYPKFKDRDELCRFITDHQPYYKRDIPEVQEYFARRYGL